jgi:cyanophycinase-like exopeptidase
VVGKGGVTFVDGSSVRFNNAADVTKAPELTISALRVGIVGTGQQFNLKKREVVPLLAPPPSERHVKNRLTSARQA